MALSLQLIDGAPSTLADLVGWLRDIDDASRRLCGRAAIFGAIDSEIADSGVIDVENLKRCIMALHRDQLPTPGSGKKRRAARGTNANVDEASAPSASESDGGASEGGRGDTLEDMVTMLGLKCPHPGDAVRAIDVADGSRTRAVKLVEAVKSDPKLKKVWLVEPRKVEGARGSPPLFIARR